MSSTSKSAAYSRDGGASVTFCATGKTGIGHLRRITNIASALKSSAPGCCVNLLTNAPLGGLTAEEISLFETHTMLPREQMAGQLARTAVGPVVVDTAVIPGLERLLNPLCLVMRETVETRLDQFALRGARSWDSIVLPVPVGGWSPDPSLLPAKRRRQVGWIYRTPETRRASRLLPRLDDTRLVLVVAGGGGSSETAAFVRETADVLIERFQRRCDVPIHVAQVAGPRSRPEDRLRAADTVIDVGAELPAVFAEADLVLSTAGYNSTLELAAIDTPVLLLPITRSYDDQLGRALWWQDRLGCVHQPDKLARSVEFMAEVVTTGRRRAPAELGPSGAQSAAAEILQLFHRTGSDDGDEIVRKSVPEARRADVGKVVMRSQLLFAAGVHTLPLRTELATGETPVCRTLSRRIQGPTARQILSSQGPATSRQDIERWEPTLERVLDALISFHIQEPDALALETFDPLGRIRPRLRPGVLTRLELAGVPTASVRSAVRRVGHELSTLRVPAVECRAIHGDFHAGQIVFEFGTPVPWLIDLDDLALGPVEIDIANFAAHFATSLDLSAAPVADAMMWLTDVLSDLYEAKTSGTLSDKRLRVHGAAALLRRALKLAEAGRVHPQTPEIFGCIESALRTEDHAANGHQRRLRAQENAFDRAVAAME